MVRAHQAQSQRLRDPDGTWGQDYAPPSVDSFRADREARRRRPRPGVVQLLTQPEDVVAHVGAGAGRFGDPLARVRQVVAVEPSEAMRTVLARDVQRAVLTNVQMVPHRWDEVPYVTGDVVFAAHVVYPMVDIEPFVRQLDAAARRWAVVLVFEAPPLSWLFPFWLGVHGELCLPPPHLPQLIDVVSELGFGPFTVERIEVEPFELGLSKSARDKITPTAVRGSGQCGRCTAGPCHGRVADHRAGFWSRVAKSQSASGSFAGSWISTSADRTDRGPITSQPRSPGAVNVMMMLPNMAIAAGSFGAAVVGQARPAGSTCAR